MASRRCTQCKQQLPSCHSRDKPRPLSCAHACAVGARVFHDPTLVCLALTCSDAHNAHALVRGLWPVLACQRLQVFALCTHMCTNHTHQYLHVCIYTIMYPDMQSMYTGVKHVDMCTNLHTATQHYDRACER